MRRRTWSRSAGLDEFERLVQLREVEVVFQPIVELRSGEVVAFEALARPPAGSSFPHITALFEEAYRRGRVGDLDWVCRAAAFSAVIDSKVPADIPVFINVEPAALSAPCPADIIGLFATAGAQCRFVVEVTERSLADDPAGLIAAVGRSRDISIGVALDDVGAQPTSLALMPLVAPDVIKLDLSLIQTRPNLEIARIVNGVLAESERTGAIILAEGVESAEHLIAAQSMGATLGQGWLFGGPAPLPPDLTIPARPLSPISAPHVIADTPFDEARQRRTPVRSSRALLAVTSTYLEREVVQSAGKAVLLSGFQSAENFTAAVARRYERLARRTVLTAALGQGMPAVPVAGVRGVNLDPDDPLCREWTVVVLGSHLAAAVIAREVEEGQFDAVITHDRELVVAAARSLALRLPAVTA